MKTLFYLRIPVEHHAVKKNNRQIHFNKRTGRRFIGKSERLGCAEKELTDAFLRAKEYNVISTYPITFPVQVTMRFFFAKEKFFTKAGTINKKLPDLSNLYQLPEDCLQKAGIIYDDHLICSHDGSRRLPHPSRNYLEIEVFTYEEA